MNPFQYVSAATPEQAVDLAGKKGRYLAGGIDLLGEMKDYIVSPEVLVNVKEMTDPLARGIRAPTAAAAARRVFDDGNDGGKFQPSPGDADRWHLGALTTIAAMADDPEIKARLPGLAEAASEVGSPQIRNVATLGGNLLQHSRCWYYRQPDLVCLKRGGTTCYGQEGENKYLALFSGCRCVTAFTSNLGVMLSALDAGVFHAGGGFLSLRKLYAKAWSDPQAHHALDPDDFVAGISIPNHRTRSAYRQQSEKSEFDWALVSCAAAGNVQEGRITDARVALGGVAPVPYLVAEAHHFLEGNALNEETAARAAEILLKEARPLAQNGYKIPLAHTLIRRTLLALRT